MVSLFGSLNAPTFIAAFLVGMVICYFVEPAPQVVVKFPTPRTAGKITYRDESDNCYRYRAEKHACPVVASRVKEQPIV